MAANIKAWLRRLPHPSTVRLDKKQLVRVGEGKNKWRDVIDIILTTQPRVLEALDSDGVMIRATELTGDGDQDDEAAAKRNGPNTELAQLGALLKEAYTDGAKAHAAAYEKLLHEHVQLMQLIANRNVALENTIEKTWEEKAAQIAGGGDFSDLMNGPLGVLVNAVMSRMLESGKPPAATDDKANGRGKKARA